MATIDNNSATRQNLTKELIHLSIILRTEPDHKLILQRINIIVKKLNDIERNKGELMIKIDSTRVPSTKG
ncbi:unnamed protein product [Rotaria sp. Silwood1]|nr:unnamed protein product [Rotaria sp. Silwood1]CAF1501867.1 unnamed protein product [Rotaria sp. Silwood1]CAF3685908.1 unnamed protein product [Rotaria sp. Silwood1]CAF4999668.1 unnamed protein product [Rotaria sp. Silwood1]